MARRSRPGPATLVAVLAVLALAAGLYGLSELFGLPNECELVRMYPNYVPVPNPPGASERYRLYHYVEGWAPAPEETNPGRPGGVPVLFIHGNAGNYAQVRSLAAESRWQHDARLAAHAIRAGSGAPAPAPPRLDWFAADFNEEMSGFDGTLAALQAEYVVAAVPHILSLYRHLPLAERPTDVMLYAHSMGALVAMLAAPAAPAGSVRVILTIAGPHAALPLLAQPAMARAYAARNAAWAGALAGPPVANGTRPGAAAGSGPAGARVRDTLVISLAGGLQDTMVPASFTSLRGLVSAKRSVAADSSRVPDVGLSIDHQAVLWCKQLVRKLAGVLLDMAASDQAAAAAAGPAGERPAAAAARRRRLAEGALLPPAYEPRGTVRSRSATPPAWAPAAMVLLTHAGRLPAFAAAAGLLLVAQLESSHARGKPCSLLGGLDAIARNPLPPAAAAGAAWALAARGLSFPPPAAPSVVLLLPSPLEAVALYYMGLGLLTAGAVFAAGVLAALPLSLLKGYARAGDGRGGKGHGGRAAGGGAGEEEAEKEAGDGAEATLGGDAELRRAGAGGGPVSPLPLRALAVAALAGASAWVHPTVALLLGVLAAGHGAATAYARALRERARAAAAEDGEESRKRPLSSSRAASPPALAAPAAAEGAAAARALAALLCASLTALHLVPALVGACQVIKMQGLQAVPLPRWDDALLAAVPAAQAALLPVLPAPSRAAGAAAAALAAVAVGLGALCGAAQVVLYAAAALGGLNLCRLALEAAGWARPHGRRVVGAKQA